MRIKMVATRYFHDVGKERSLDMGREYDLPDPVALSLVASGAARVVAPSVPVQPEEHREMKPLHPPESGRMRRRE